MERAKTFDWNYGGMDDGRDGAGQYVKAEDYDALWNAYQQLRGETLQRGAGSDRTPMTPDEMLAYRLDAKEAYDEDMLRAFATLDAEIEGLKERAQQAQRDVATLTATQKNALAVLELKQQRDGYLGMLSAILLDRKDKALIISGEAISRSGDQVDLDFTHDRMTGQLIISRSPEKKEPSKITIAR